MQPDILVDEQLNGVIECCLEYADTVTIRGQCLTE